MGSRHALPVAWGQPLNHQHPASAMLLAPPSPNPLSQPHHTQGRVASRSPPPVLIQPELMKEMPSESSRAMQSNANMKALAVAAVHAAPTPLRIAARTGRCDAMSARGIAPPTSRGSPSSGTSQGSSNNSPATTQAAIVTASGLAAAVPATPSSDSGSMTVRAQSVGAVPISAKVNATSSASHGAPTVVGTGARHLEPGLLSTTPVFTSHRSVSSGASPASMRGAGALPHVAGALPTFQLNAEPVALLASSKGVACDNHLRIKRLEEQVSQLVQEHQQQPELQNQPQDDQCRDAEVHARELAQAKEELEKKVRECEILKEAKDMFAGDLKTMSEDRHAVKEAFQEVKSAKVKLEEQLRSLCSEKEALEGRVAAAAEAARKLQSDRADLEMAVEKSVLETRELRCRAAIAEDQANKAEDRARKAENDCLHLQKKADQCREELCVLQRKYDEQQEFVLELEGQILREHRTLSADQGQSPGDRMRNAKHAPDTMLLKEHGSLKKEMSKVRCDLDLAVQKIRDQRFEIQQLRAQR